MTLRALTQTLAAALTCTCCLMGLLSCGGGVGSGGTGAASISSGTVTGFGSVIVDGVAFDNRGASTLIEEEPGLEVPAQVKLGHRVGISTEIAGTAQVIRIEPTVIGVVASVQSGAFELLGQSILVNADSKLGPITQLGDYADANAIKVGDAVEVYGVRKQAGTTPVVQATRVDKRVTPPNFVRISGLMRSVDGVAKRFTIDGLTVDYASATVDTAIGNLVEGASVVVFGRSDRLSRGSDGLLHLQATALRSTGSRSEGLDAYASGVVSELDTASKHFHLDELSVSYTNATVASGAASLANGRYVQVRGMTDAGRSFAASAVTVRDGTGAPDSKLKGTVVGLDLAAKQFSVRGVSVDFRTATIERCPATLSDGLFVEVEGSANFAGVLARKVQCLSESAGSTVERSGMAGSVDRAASTFVLTRSGAPAVNVAWTPQTFFAEVTPASLPGAKVEVEGTFVGAVLQATTIKLDR